MPRVTDHYRHLRLHTHHQHGRMLYGTWGPEKRYILPDLRVHHTIFACTCNFRNLALSNRACFRILPPYGFSACRADVLTVSQVGARVWQDLMFP
jgi:hypothetical protein